MEAYMHICLYSGMYAYVHAYMLAYMEAYLHVCWHICIAETIYIYSTSKCEEGFSYVGGG